MGFTEGRRKGKAEGKQGRVRTQRNKDVVDLVMSGLGQIGWREVVNATSEGPCGRMAAIVMEVLSRDLRDFHQLEMETAGWGRGAGGTPRASTTVALPW